MKDNDVDIYDKWGIDDIFMNKEDKIILRNTKKCAQFCDRFRNESNKFTMESVPESRSTED